MNTEGVLLCAKYAASPNFFGYCGPRKSATILDHLKEGIADTEMGNVLSEFETLYPYLQYIARENRLPDPYDRRVVDAYWIGNQLLRKVDSDDYAAFLREQLALDTKVTKDQFRIIRIKTNKHAFLPHHAFHVFNIFKRTGKTNTDHTRETMDECRIGWGTVEKVLGQTIDISYTPLVIQSGKLAFGESVRKQIHLDYKTRVFIKHIKKGDLVTFHWSQICDVVKPDAIRRLQYYTRQAILYYNQNDA